MIPPPPKRKRERERERERDREIERNREERSNRKLITCTSFQFPWVKLKFLKYYIPFFDPHQVVWDIPNEDEEDPEGYKSYTPVSKRSGIRACADNWDVLASW